MIDLNQVSLALRNATSRSLVLLDEFGKGTAPSGPSPALLLDPAALLFGFTSVADDALFDAHFLAMRHPVVPCH